MIERIFVDNIRCFVNFEWKPSKLALLLGENGAGKSLIGRVIWGLRRLIADEMEVPEWFTSRSRTRWDQRLEQRIEIELRLPVGLYSYEIVVEHDPEKPDKAQLKREVLRLESTLLLAFDNGSLQLYDDEGQPTGPAFPTHRNRLGLGTVAPSKTYKKLTAFKRWFNEDVWYFKPDPRSFTERTDEKARFLQPDLNNFASWYPASITQDLDVAARVKASLAPVLPGFETLRVDNQRPVLYARFKASSKTAYNVAFNEISDGQRALIALYVVLHAVLKPGRLVIFDEPDNYVALREIQPWLMEVIDVALTSEGPQVWLISHHPEMLNRLAPSYGRRFFRHENGPSRTEPFKGAPGLTPAEAVAREWAGSGPHE